ncbi:MAG: exosortase-associated EpsI family protein [Phycisphaerales bacterium]
MISFHKRAKTAYVSLLIVMVIATVAFPLLIANLGIYLRKKPLDIRESLSSIPTRLADWSQHGEDQQYGAEMVEELGTPIYLSRNYKRRNEMLNVHVAYYTGIIDDVPHIPERCWAANGNWERVTGYDGVKPISVEIDGASPSDVPVNRASGEQYDALSILDPVTGVVQEVYLPVGDYQMTVVAVMPNAADPKRRQVGGYFFIANGRISPSARGVKNLAFDPTEEYAYYCKVQFSYQSKITDRSQETLVPEFLEIVEDVLPSLIPELVQCLPDWVEVEARRNSPPLISKQLDS